MAVATFAFYAAWALLLGLFACAYVQGADFASTKDSATVFGCVIGLAAFFAWLAVEDDEEEDEDGQEENEGAPAAAADGGATKTKVS